MRAFVVGNGPSLADTPLDEICSEVSYAVGRINLIYPRTKWRPTFYVMAEQREHIDEQLTRQDMRQVIGRNGTHAYVQSGLVGLTGMARVEPFTTCACILKRRPPVYWHLPTLCSYGGSLFVAMQLATLAGYDPIYLVGCDLDGEHFDEHYGTSKVQTELWRSAHRIAARSCPARILNATIGGSLEVYPRIDLCQVI